MLKLFKRFKKFFTANDTEVHTNTGDPLLDAMLKKTFAEAKATIGYYDEEGNMVIEELPSKKKRLEQKP